MRDQPTRGASEPARTWGRSPVASRLVRTAAYLLPVVLAWLAVRVTSQHYLGPDGPLGTVAWLIQAIVVSVVVSSAVERLSRRLLPLAAMLNLALAFPDRAPSRFGLALRAGSTRQLRQRLDQVGANGLGDTPQEAAAQALELVTALSGHDRRTRGHSERVRAYAELIAQELELSEADRARLAWGVLLHDIGKLTVGAEILNKDAPLTDDEWATLQAHPAAGAEIMAPLAAWLGDWARAATDHHERWDGGGYPSGLAGPEISLAGRITAVADAYDVITSTRSYKAPMSAAAAREELVRCSGSQFDPAVVRALLAVSVGRRWNGGRLAWLAELPSLGRLTTTLANSAVTATAAGTALVVSLAGVSAATTSEPPAQLAMIATVADVPTSAVAPTSTVAVVDTGADTGATVGADNLSPTEPVPTEPPDTATPVTEAALATAVVTEPPTTAPATAPPTTPAPAPTAPPEMPDSTVSPTAAVAPPGGGILLYLTNPGSGDTSSSGIRTLSDSAPTGGALPNYDTDRDGLPGLRIKRDDKGLSASKSHSRQDWIDFFTQSQTLSGQATVTLHVGGQNLRGGDAIGVRVGLYRCTIGCTLVASGDWTGVSQDGAFQPAVVSLGTVEIAAQFGTTLLLRVVAPNEITDNDINLAYDTAAQPAVLSIG